MAGKRSGVGVRMTSDNPQLVHTHKLALAVPQSASAVGAVKQYQEGLNTVYFYFSNSAVRYNRLRAVYELLEDKRLRAVYALLEDERLRAVYALL